MRDTGRIAKMLTTLADYWYRHPDLRLGQIIENMKIGYYTEDQETLMKITNAIKNDKRLKVLQDRFGYDRLLDYYHANDFSEFVVKTGGDTLTFRVYEKDGKYSICER